MTLLIGHMERCCLDFFRFFLNLINYTDCNSHNWLLCEIGQVNINCMLGAKEESAKFLCIAIHSK